MKRNTSSEFGPYPTRAGAFSFSLKPSEGANTGQS